MIKDQHLLGHAVSNGSVERMLIKEKKQMSKWKDSEQAFCGKAVFSELQYDPLDLLLLCSQEHFS